MKTYVTNGNSHFNVNEVEVTDASLIKVKVTHLMPTEFDVSVFSGRYAVDEPFVIGHIAIGLVSDDRPEYDLMRGQKVLLNPYIEITGEHSREDHYKTMGVDTDGFFKEYVFMPFENIIPLPTGLEDSDAILTDKIALALGALNTFEKEKGNSIVIIGSNATCHIMAQLAIYFQMVPIMIGSNEPHLNFANQKGIYYTINSTKDVPYDRVKEITGGRMADFAVLNLDAENTGVSLFPLVKDEGCAVVVSANKIGRMAQEDVSYIGRHKLKVEGISSGMEEYPSAVNILVQDILHLDNFIDKEVELKDVEPTFREVEEDFQRYYNIVIKL